MARFGTMKELETFCVGCKVLDEADFQEVVASYLQLTGDRPQVLAEECEAAVSTVTRWAAGHARPRPRIRRFIVEWIGRRVASLS